MERNGTPIEAAHAKTVSTGIAYAGVEMEGLVPLYEEYDAMLYARYNENEWERLAWQRKARAVAHYRLRHWIRIHQEDALAAELERKRKK